MAELNNLTVWGGDAGNAYLNGSTIRETLFVILGRGTRRESSDHREIILLFEKFLCYMV